MAFASNVGIVVGLLASSLLAGPARVQLYPAPDLNVSQLARDRHGFIWLAAEKGLFRFDGWHYHAVPGFPFRGARFIAIGPDGIVWAGGQQGLARRTQETWKVITTDPIEGMTLSPAGLWVNAGGLRLVKPDGAERRFPEAKPSGELVADAEGVLWFPCGPNVCTLRPPDFSLEVRRISEPGPWQKVTPEKGGRGYWLSSRESIALVEDGIVKSRQAARASSLPEFSPLLDPTLAPDGTVWVTRPDGRAEPGLRRWPLFSMSAVVALFADPSKLWFWAGDQLASSQRSADWEVWQGEAFTSTTPEGFLPVPGHDAPLLLTDRGVFELTPENRQWQRRPAASMVDIMDMLEDRHGGYWATARDEGLVRLNRDFAVVERFPTLCAAVDSTRALLRDGQGRIWVGGKAPNCFFEIQGEPGRWKFVPQKLPEATVSATTIVADAQGRPWVGYEYGIASLQDSGVWQRIETSEPVTLVRSIEFDGPDTLWVAHRRPGAFTRLQRQGNQWRVERFPAGRYGAIQTEYIRRDSRGWIWRGTLNGEVRIARPGHYEPGEWLHINYANGLASKSISLQGWFEDTSGSIWLAGSTSGVTRVRPTEAWFAAPRAQPVITRLSAAGQTWFDPERIPHQVPSDGPLEIELSTIDANPFQPAPLRYRWQGAAWKSSTDGHLSMANLPPGNYTLEAAYMGTGLAPVLHWELQVGHPAARLLVPSLGFGAFAILVPWGWRKRVWLRYWLRKPWFLAGRLLRRDEQPVNWTNYAGKTLASRYVLGQPLSRGGFSIAYAARDRQTGEPVVVKVLHREPGQEGGMRNRFAHEVAALHTLDHPGVVRLLNSWISPNGEPCLAMPSLDGPTLRQWITQHAPLSRLTVARIVEQLGAALAAIHERGIVHRDLKPENVILCQPGTPEEQAVIIDFGSSATRGPELDMAHTVTLTGSLHYLAPERLGGQYSPASDIYSFGAIALELLTGKRPAEMETSPSDAAFTRNLSNRIGPEAAAAIAAALHHQPSLRPPEAQQWSAQLAAMLRAFSATHPDGPPSN